MIIKIKRAELKITIILALTLFLLTSIIIGITINTNNVIGVNITNQTVRTHAFVWNTEPNLYRLEISPDPIELSPGNTTTVNCTGYFWDYNGWQDIANGTVNATLWYRPYSNASAPDDKNHHYTNSSCTICSEISGSQGQNGTCTCTFSVYYFANWGNWSCNMTIGDFGINITDKSRNMTFNDSLVANGTIAKLIALDVPPTIEYGNLSVTETSDPIRENVTNWGNVHINVSVRGYGGQNESKYYNLSMICQLGNITLGNERYSLLNSTNYDNMTNLTDVNTQIINLTVKQRTTDNFPTVGQDVNITYWKLRIPLSVGGHCNGTIIFNAIEANVTG